jgi:hypothetical protein
MPEPAAPPPVFDDPVLETPEEREKFYQEVCFFSEPFFFSSGGIWAAGYGASQRDRFLTPSITPH